jgi:hypothetical protein
MCMDRSCGEELTSEKILAVTKGRMVMHKAAHRFLWIKRARAD